MVNTVRFVVSEGEYFTLGPKTWLPSLRASGGKRSVKKGERKLLKKADEGGECPLTSLGGDLHTFLIGY